MPPFFKPDASVVFRKRTFSPALFMDSAASVASSLPTLLRALWRPRTSATVREQVMLAVTSVNDCRYCTWVHTSLALKADVDLDELRTVLQASSLGDRLGPAQVAILFGQHYADTRRQPTQDALAALSRAWSAAQVREIMAYIHAIYFANLSGNSMDAWLARLRGQRVESGHPVTELLAALIAAPVLLGIRLAHRRS